MDLWHIEAVDGHAHPVGPDAHLGRDFVRAFTESGDASYVESHARRTLFYRRSLREIAGLLGCGEDEDEILARRESLGAEALAAICFERARLATVLLDDGLAPDKSWTVDRHARFVDARRVLRLETLAQELFQLEDRFDRFLDRFVAAIDPPPAPVVALKSIAAYRSGLELERVSRATAAELFRTVKHEVGTRPFRLVDKPLVDYLAFVALECAARHDMPVQFHTGFGDTDLDLRLANPLHLRRALEDPALARARIVLLHASYPFVREAGYLASVYPNVHVDFGLAVPFLSVAGMRATVEQLLELAPTSKVHFSSDAHGIPELFYLGAKRGREVLGAVLESAIRDGDLSADEAEEAARAILAENARQLYGLSASTSGPLRRQ